MKKKSHGKFNAKFVLMWTGLILWGAAAFCLPVLIFDIQDKRNGDALEKGEREALNFLGLDINYEEDLSDRLRGFAQGTAAGKKYQVMETAFPEEYDSEAAIWEKLEEGGGITFIAEVASQFVSWPASEFYYSPDSMDVEVAAWKRYLVYDEENINFMLWYVEYSLFHGNNTIQLVMDEESGTVYYMQGIHWREMPDPAESKDKRCRFLGALFPSYFYLQQRCISFNQYYRSDLTYEGPLNLNSDTYYCSLEYGDDALICELYYDADAKQYPEDRRPELWMGIPEIGELIPDMDNRNLPKYEGEQEMDEYEVE